MRKMGSDEIIGFGLLALSAFAAWRSLNIAGRSVGTVAGPSFVPWLMVGAIIVLAITLIVRARRKASILPLGDGRGAASIEVEPDRMNGRNLARIAIFAAMLVAYSAAFMPFGYLPATYTVFVAGMLVLGRRVP